MSDSSYDLFNNDPVSGSDNTKTTLDDSSYDLINESDITNAFNPDSFQDSISSSEPVTLTGPDYTTSFCRPRQTESTAGSTISSAILTFARYFDIRDVSWYPYLISLSGVGGLFIFILLWYFIKYPDLVKPFTFGGVKLCWYLFLLFLILSVLVLFIHFLYYIAYFIEVTIHYFNMTLNPLLNEKVSSLCCFFSDYLNWLIFYPAMIYYLIIFILLVLFDVLVLIPILALFGFIVGFLFSLLGERETSAPGLVGQISNVMKDSSVSGMFQKGLQSMKNSTEGVKQKLFGSQVKNP